MLRKKRFYIGGAIVLTAIAYLSYAGFAGGATYYYTVGELFEMGTSTGGENIRVSGEVAPGSVQQEAAGRTLGFTITDGEENLPVVYQGVVPDAFTVGGEVVVEGHLGPDGVFQASTLLAKCPSRYVPAK